jgi:hypothetical protein
MDRIYAALFASLCCGRLFPVHLSMLLLLILLLLLLLLLHRRC